MHSNSKSKQSTALIHRATYPRKGIASRLRAVSLFFSLREGSVRARESRATKQQDVRNESGSQSRVWSRSCLTHFARQTKKKDCC